MSGANDAPWTLSALGYEDSSPTVARIRDLPSSTVEDGREQMGRIRWLARQAAFERVLESGERWKRLVERAAAELGKEGEISRQTQIAAGTELGAFVLAAERFQDDLRSNTVGRDGLDDDAKGQFERIVAEVSESPQMLLLREIARSNEPNLLSGSGHRGLRMLAPSGPDAQDAVVAVVGLLGRLIHPLVVVLRDGYEADAGHLEALASEVKAGIPAFVRIEEKPGDEGARMSYMELPLQEMAVIGQALRVLDDGDPDSAISIVLRGRERALVFFGDVSAGSTLIDGSGREGLNEIPEARLELDADLIGSEPIDYWSQVSFGYQRGDVVEAKFEGVVQQGTVEDRRITLECEGAAALTEHMAGGMVAANIEPAELIEVMIAQSGWEGELSLSEDAGEPCSEEFEVVAPLHGLSVGEEISMGGVSLVPTTDLDTILAELDLDTAGEVATELIPEFRRASAYVRARVTTDKPHLAEDQGLAAIDTAVAWLVVRGRYGLAKLPDGTPQEFSRQERLNGPRRGPVVMVRGIETNRQWLRWPERVGGEQEGKLSGRSSLRRPPLPSELAVSLDPRDALIAG